MELGLAPPSEVLQSHYMLRFAEREAFAKLLVGAGFIRVEDRPHGTTHLMPDVDALWQAGMGGMAVTSAAIAAQNAATQARARAVLARLPRSPWFTRARNLDRLPHRRWETARARKLTAPIRAQLGHRIGHDGQGLPFRNRSCPFPRDGIVGNQRETPAQFDGGRQFAGLVESGTDCGSIGFGDNEHWGSMGRQGRARQAVLVTWPSAKARKSTFAIRGMTTRMKGLSAPPRQNGLAVALSAHHLARSLT